jgi:parvulin-like peptidyl-prolyl isomerase
MAHSGFRASRLTMAAWIVAACLFSCARNPDPPDDSDVVVATVNGAGITLKDLKTEIARIRGVTPAVPARSGTRTEVSLALRRLIERAVVLQEGERLGVAAERAEVEEEIRQYRADFPPGGLEKALLQGGVDAEKWRDGLRQSILYRKSAEAIARPLAGVTEEEVEKAYRETYGKSERPERIRVRQFLFDTPEMASGARVELVEGASPDGVVNRFSSSESAPLDIDLGFLTRGELPEEVAGELFDLPPGGVSRVIRRDSAYSLFLVVGKTPRGPYSYAEKAPEIRSGLLGQRREEAFRTWLDAEVGKARIQVQEEIVAGLTGEGK